jgi:hypothetical protein
MSTDTKEITFKANGKDYTYTLKRYTAEESFNIGQHIPTKFESQCWQVFYGVTNPPFESVDEVKKLDYEVFLELLNAVGDFNGLDAAFLLRLENLPRQVLPPSLRPSQ